jgi:RNA polymerase sigma-70 factor (ECF subfamily)
MTRRTNADWLQDLRAGGEEQTAALEELRAHLVKAARYALVRGGRVAHGAVDQTAEDCAQDALVAILARLDDFRGDSRFTTWAYAFAVNMALVASRRVAWRHVSLDALLAQAGSSAWIETADTRNAGPERSARRAEAWTVVRDVIDRELTDRQRQALKAVVVDDVPLDELVRHWGSNRNAIYKLLHDARRRLRTRLEARGFDARDVLRLFGTAG